MYRRSWLSSDLFLFRNLDISEKVWKCNFEGNMTMKVTCKRDFLRMVYDT